MHLTTRKAIDALRREYTDLQVLPDDDTGMSAWTRIRDAEVRAAVAALPEVQRRAVELAFFGGLAHPEVADRLGVPLGTAKKRIPAGIGRLRTELASMVLDDPDDAVALAGARPGRGLPASVRYGSLAKL